MVIGHLSVSYAAKAANRRIPLWVLFVAAQALDIIWALLVILGIEKVRIVPGITASNPLDLYYFPYSHSLVASIVWSAVIFIAFRVFFPGKESRRNGMIVGLVVFSHWVLDFLVHRPDLPLYKDTLKVGLGLWNFPLFSFLLEAGILFGGMWLYLHTMNSIKSAAKYGVISFGLLLLVINAINTFSPPFSSSNIVAILSLSASIAFTVAAAWLDGKTQAYS